MIKQFCLIVIFSLFAVSASANQYKDGWSDRDVKLVGQSCLLAMKFYATVDYMQKNQVTEDQLTEEFNNQLEVLLDGYRPQCACISDKIANKFSLSEYKDNMKTISAQYTKQILESEQCGKPPFQED